MIDKELILQVGYDKSNLAGGRMYFTDYPLVELGDTPGEEAPIRQVEFISYDGDKYVEVRVDGVSYTFKSGYLYKVPGRKGAVECLLHNELVELQRNQNNDG